MGSRAAGWVADRSRTAAFLLYLVVGLAYFGLPILGDPAGRCICLGSSPDPGAYMWALYWWPDALVHGHNPFVSPAIFAPEGANLAQGQLIPGAALVLAPVTALAGPVAAYDLMLLLGPVLAAWTAFLLCRRVTGAFWPSLVGGYTFGFSAYVLAQMLGHPNLVLVFLVPVIALLVLRRVEGELGRTAYVVGLAACLAGQFLLSPEVFSMTLAFGVVGLLAAWWWFADARRRVRDAALLAAGAVALAAAVLAPYLYYALKAAGPAVDVARARHFSTDLLNLVLPTPLQRLGRTRFLPVAASFRADFAESGGYLGIPLLVIVARLAATTWSRPRTRWLLAMFGVIVVASLGSRLQIAGHETIALPWAVLDGLPVLGAALPARFMVFAALVVAMIAALWLASAREPVVGRVVLGALAIAVLVPNLGPAPWHADVRKPPFFARHGYRAFLRPGQIGLLLPWGINGNSMLWQVEAHLGFRQAGGYTGGRLPDGLAHELHRRDQDSSNPPTGPAELRAFLSRHRVRLVVLDPRQPDGWTPVLARAGLRPQPAGGMVLYRVPRPLTPG